MKKNERIESQEKEINLLDFIQGFRLVLSGVSNSACQISLLQN